jgi:hypothetical protein
MSYDLAPQSKGTTMLFHVTWQFGDRSEEGTKRALTAFAAWQPPAEAEFKGFYGTADGRGGVAIIEVDSAATLARTTAPWTPWLDFTVTPILPIEEASAISGEGIAFRESVA